MEQTIKSQKETQSDDSMATVVRFQGKWYKIAPKKYEPERQTYSIAWEIIKKGVTSKQVYREWFLNEREDSKLLYPSFRKDE
jgi:hypothetical protein